ncbi:MAG: hypothetical protein ACRDSH_23620, partial [Pseudonocardiaceae bacterium]
MLVAAALVGGLMLPILPSNSAADPAAAPPVGEHASAPGAGGQNLIPAGSPPDASAPGAVTGTDRGPARGQVTLTTDRTAVPAAAPPAGRLEIPAPQPAPTGLAGLGQRVDPPAARQPTDFPSSGGHHESSPPPPRQPPISESQAEQLKRIAAKLAEIRRRQQGGGNTPPPSHHPPSKPPQG